MNAGVVDQEVQRQAVESVSQVGRRQSMDIPHKTINTQIVNLCDEQFGFKLARKRTAVVVPRN